MFQTPAFLLAVTLATGSALAAPSGAIYTTNKDATIVNANVQYGSASDVYLSGGPQNTKAAGLTDGTYYFQVTDPSGKVLLSTDPAVCRQLSVVGGRVVGSIGPPCKHSTGPLNSANGVMAVQLMPFSVTPNNGGEYKAWAVPVGDATISGPLLTGTVLIFSNRDSKTDNFKVRGSAREIDTRFFNQAGQVMDGMEITWTDTLGASNNKWSYENLALDIHHEAHVEDVENGTHTITIGNQPGCTVGSVYLAGNLLPNSGPQSVSVWVDPNWPGDTIFVDVMCR